MSEPASEYAPETCCHCEGLGCLYCNKKGFVMVHQPAQRCRHCGGDGCIYCGYTGWSGLLRE
ncbi:MAG: hypothetical protein KO206_06830 [Methanomicrobiaceae archaeon]|uniref:Uncharacterized protein n=1 Tax=hydrocarbon metagenome TaxID=938273 RepID=A0A0W8FF54_9ZZZZ|nr:hypothetical protein [Methanomicrobiaceae archaeon]MDD5419955.1 hypothetical protein [Methanomicrobiaceae archaeon]